MIDFEFDFDFKPANISKWELKPGDVIVLKTPPWRSQKRAEGLVNTVKKLLRLRGIDVIAIPRDVDISIIRKDTIEEIEGNLDE